MAARTLNILVGIWLFISAFCWPHSSAQFANTWILGVICVVVAAIAMRVEQVRFLNTLVGIWLFISAFALPGSSPGTNWNNALVGVAIFIISLTPTVVMPRQTRTA
jgi:uncharacterized membrane protein SirB2